MGCMVHPGNAELAAQNESAYNKFNELFPVEHTAEESIESTSGKYRENLMGDPTEMPDETDNIYPKH